jgi:hypothetical protein
LLLRGDMHAASPIHTGQELAEPDWCRITAKPFEKIGYTLRGLKKKEERIGKGEGGKEKKGSSEVHLNPRLAGLIVHAIHPQDCISEQATYSRTELN